MLKRTLLVAAAMAGALTLSACEEESTAEEISETVQEQVEKTAQELENQGEALEDTARETLDGSSLPDTAGDSQ